MPSLLTLHLSLPFPTPTPTPTNMSAQVKVDTTDSVITQSGDVQPQVEVVGQQGIKREASCEEDERVAKVSKQEHSVPVVESVTKPEAVVDSEVNPAAVPVAKVESKADADMRMKFAAMVAVYGIPVASKCAGCEGLNGMSAPCVQIAPGTACLRCAVHNKNCSLGLPPNVSFGEYVHAGHDHHAGQDRAGHAQAGQNHAGQNHAGQNHAGQNHAGQKHAEHITSRIPIVRCLL